MSVHLYNREEKETFDYEDWAIAASYLGDVSELNFSSTESYLAISCADRKIRVIDTTSGECECTLEFSSFNQGYIKFSPDDTKMLIVDDQFAYSIYDLKNQKSVFKSADHLDTIKDCHWDDETGLYIVTANGLYRLGEDYDILFRAPGGLVITNDDETIISSDEAYPTASIYSYNIYTLEDLFDLLNERYGKSPLTETERLIYNID